jgi:PAS domain S-box-containing protein
MPVNQVEQKNNPGNSDEKPGNEKKDIFEPGVAIVNAYTLIAILYCASSTVLFYYVVENIFLAAVHLLALISVIINYLILIRTKNFDRATNIIILIGTIVVVSLFATGGWANTGYLWSFVYLPFAFFLSGGMLIMYRVSALIGGCLLVVLLHFAGVITVPYSPVALVNYFAALVIFNACMFLFQKATVKREEFLSYTETLLQAAPDAVIVIDDEGRIVKWNPKSEKLFGWMADEVFGKELSEIIIPHRYREAHKKGLKLFMETGEGPVLGKTIEIQALNKRHVEFAVALSISPAIVQGKTLFIGFVRDITEKNKAEEKIKESEKMFSTLFYKSPVMKAIIEASTGKYIDVNDAFVEFLGYAKEEIVGKTSSEINMPGPLGEHGQIVKNIQKDGFVRELEMQLTAMNGKTRWVSTNIDLVNLNGTDCFLLAAVNITGRKTAEEKLLKLSQELEEKVTQRTEELAKSEKLFRAMIEKDADMKTLALPEGKVFYASPSVTKILGYENEEFMTTPAFELIHPDDIPGLMEGVADIIQTPGKSLYRLQRIKHKNGAWLWCEGTIANMLHEPAVGALVSNFRDVTQRKEVEENMKITLKEISDYKYALDESSIVAITDQKGIIKYVNENFCKISKYSREELIGQDHRIINSGYHSKEFIHYLWVTIARGKIWKGELKNKAKDGTIYWVDTTIIPFLNEQGKPYQYIAIRADITERKQAEQSLLESRQLLSAIIDNSTAVIYVKNLQGQYLLVNHRFSELFHLSEEAILGKTDYDFFPKKDADAFREMDKRTANAKHALTEEEIVPQDDGMHIYISVKSTLRNPEGIPYAIFGISTDITERKKAEEAILRAESNYREIFDKANDAIYIYEIGTGKILEVNERACEITGYTKEELIESTPGDFLTGDPAYSMQHYFNYLQKAADGKPQLFEWLGKNKDGSHNWLEVNLKKASIGGQERILAFFREINDRKRAQMEVQKLTAELEEKVIERTAELQLANKELEAFSYSVSHDLRSPLRIIDGYADIVISDYKDKLDNEGNRVLYIIKANARRMGQLIDDLLHLSQTGRKELIIHFTDMNKLVKSVVDEQLSLTGNKAIITIGDLEPVVCDSSLIQQVWINLISNALKYSRNHKKPEIQISSIHQKDQVVYLIKDNGVGFDMQYAGKLFGVFQRLHKTAEFEGTGIGLALVNRILTRHKGKIWVESEPGKGASFYFSLPA